MKKLGLDRSQYSAFLNDQDSITAFERLFSKVNSLSMPCGSLIPFGGTSAPEDWLLCDGAAVSRTTFSELFKVIGTSFGAGDGSTTFNVPDTREAALAGVGTRATGVASHDAFTLGQFKDDQMQVITGRAGGSLRAYRTGTTDQEGALSLEAGAANAAGGSAASFDYIAFNSANSPSARTGTVTRGKLLGVNYIIKCV